MVRQAVTSHIAIFSLVIWNLSGCVGEPVDPEPLQIDPPELQLQSDRHGVPRDRLTRVTIRNGRGEVIVDQKPKLKESTEIQPPAGTFDGTLVIEWRTVDGDSGRQTLTHDPGKSLALDFDWDEKAFTLTEKPRPQPMPARFVFSPFGGYLERALGGTGAFTDISGGETALVEVDEMDGFRVGAELGYRLFGPTRVGVPGLGFSADAVDLSLLVEYTKLEGDDSRFVAPGTDETGITFPYFVDGSEGLDFGLTGAEARIESRVEGIRLRFGDSKVWVEGEDGEPGHWEFRLSPGIHFSYGRHETEARIRNATFPDIFGRDETDLDEWQFGVEVGGRAQYFITPTFAPFLGGSARLYHRWGDLEGVQQTTAPGTLTPAQQEPLEYSDDDSGFGARFAGELGVEARFNRFLSAEIKGFAAYDTSTPFVDKRDNPADGGPGIGTDDSFDIGGIAFLTLRF